MVIVTMAFEVILRIAALIENNTVNRKELGVYTYSRI